MRSDHGSRSLRDYPGNKAADGVYHRIIGLMPRHDTYIEAYVGSGAIKDPFRSKNLHQDRASGAIASAVLALVWGFFRRRHRRRRRASVALTIFTRHRTIGRGRSYE